MKKDYIQELLHKYEEGTCTHDETVLLQQWLDELAAGKTAYRFDGGGRTGVRNKLLASVLKRKPAAVISLLPVWAGRVVAAAVLVALALTGGWYYNSHRVITIAATGAVNRIVLPDSSVVWLNRNSEIAYQASFRADRTIELKKGEAFFDVKKDAQHPFVVQAGEVTTTVLGTSFSIVKDYYTRGAKVAVVTGKVAVSVTGNNQVVLTPGGRVRYEPAMAAALKDTASASAASGWIQGETILEHVSLNEVANWLHTFYNVPVRNTHTGYKGNYYLSFKHGITIEEAIRIINLVSNQQQVRFSLHDNEVVIE